MAAEIVYRENTAQLYQEAARLLGQAISSVRRDTVTVALPGGRSIVGVLKELAANPNFLPRDVAGRVQYFMVDERIVPLTHQESNFRLVKELFFSTALKSGLIHDHQLHPFVYDPQSPNTAMPENCIRRYEEELRRYGGTFDVIVFGVGEDAHVGALFPNHHSVQNTSSTFITMRDSPKPPPDRMSASVALVKRAGTVLALFIGEAKREALRRYLDPKLSVYECPAKLIDEVPRGYALTDLREA